MMIPRKKVLCFGNELLEGDRTALEVGGRLQKELNEFEFIFTRIPEKLLDYEKEEEVFVLDVVRGIKNVRVIRIEELQGKSIVSGHDYDLGMFLQLSGLKNARIIGIPMGMSLGEAVGKVRILLENE